jgi:hypothetical protein
MGIYMFFQLLVHGSILHLQTFMIKSDAIKILIKNRSVILWLYVKIESDMTYKAFSFDTYCRLLQRNEYLLPIIFYMFLLISQ